MSEFQTLIVYIMALLLLPKISTRNKFSFYSFGIIGVPLHEFSHYIIASLVGFKVTEVKLIQDPTKNNGCAGYVSYSYVSTLINDFLVVLVGLAPLYIGCITIYLITLGFGYPIFDENINPFQFTLDMMSQPDIKWVIYSWLITSITLNMVPSLQDVKTSLRGLLLSTIIFFVIGYVFKVKLLDVVAPFSEGITSSIIVGLTITIPFIIIYFIYDFFAAFRKRIRN